MTDPVTPNPCDCGCHSDPEILLCGKCRTRHDLDGIMVGASRVVFDDDETKAKFLADWKDVAAPGSGRTE